MEFLVECFVEFFFSRPTQIDDMEYQLKSMPEKTMKIDGLLDHQIFIICKSENEHPPSIRSFDQMINGYGNATKVIVLNLVLFSRAIGRFENQRGSSSYVMGIIGPSPLIEIELISLPKFRSDHCSPALRLSDGPVRQ